MITVCPHCEYPNPAEAQICEQCGTSLVEQPCFNCQTIVSFSELNCPNCGAATGKTWWVVILPAQKDNWQSGEYLDSQQRYQIITPLTLHHNQYFSTRVLDHQPLTLSNFEYSSPETDEVVTTSEAAAPSQSTLTPLVQLYLELREKLPDLIPLIHDHWQDATGEYLLLEDRSQWQNLAQIENLPNLQILTYLKQMTALWSEFSQQELTRTFLEPNNWYLDEDECLVLQTISPNIAPEDADLANLGQLWQNLFTSSEASLQQLYQCLATGEINNIAQLNLAIEEIESQLDLTDYSLPSLNLPLAAEDQEEEEAVEEAGETLSEPTEGDNLPTIVLPMQLLSVTDAAITDIGLQRSHNEDYYGIVTHTEKRENAHKIKYGFRGLYIVCDGMGGHAAGEVASRMAVESLQEYFQQNWRDELPSEEVIRQGILLTNQKIYQENLQQGKAGSGRMGTTLVMALLQDTRGAIAHVGDSRIYHITRKRGITQLTLDHAVAQQEVLCGVEPEIAYRRHDAYQLTQAIGPRDNTCVHPEIQFLDFKEDTILLLCSDGFSDNNFLETTEVKNHLLSLFSSKANLEQELRQLLELGNQYNGHDNLTAILVRIKVQPSLERI